MPLEKSPLRIATLADQCVQCGLCLPACPTYTLDRSETESPRGRIAIAAALARGEAEPTAKLRAHLDHCLGCLSCERVCPAHVKYGELLVETRALLGPAPQRPHQLLDWSKRPALLRGLRRTARLLGWPRWRPALLRRLPRNSAWRAALATLPANLPRPIDAGAATTDAPAAIGEPSIALFPGCVASVDDADAQTSALRLLRAAGYRVTLLPAFCCGALDLHGGASAAAEQAAEQVREAWTRSGATQLLSITSGCLGTLRRALPEVVVSDPYALLLARAEQLRFRALPERVALQLPCTQVNVARSESDLLELLRRIPELDLQRVAATHCCGAAGSHLLEFPERAEALREPMLARIVALAPQRWLSSNIGCRLHLAAGLQAQGHAWSHSHPLTLLAQQLESTASP